MHAIELESAIARTNSVPEVSGVTPPPVGDHPAQDADRLLIKAEDPRKFVRRWEQTGRTRETPSPSGPESALKPFSSPTKIGGKHTAFSPTCLPPSLSD
jgi:hypothetical protein